MLRAATGAKGRLSTDRWWHDADMGRPRFRWSLRKSAGSDEPVVEGQPVSLPLSGRPESLSCSYQWGEPEQAIGSYSLALLATRGLLDRVQHLVEIHPAL